MAETFLTVLLGTHPLVVHAVKGSRRHWLIELRLWVHLILSTVTTLPEFVVTVGECALVSEFTKSYFPYMSDSIVTIVKVSALGSLEIARVPATLSLILLLVLSGILLVRWLIEADSLLMNISWKRLLTS